MVYGCGDNNLSSQLVVDIRKMERVGSSAGFNIVVEADFDNSRREENEEDGLPEGLSAKTTRFLVRKSENPDELETPPEERLPEFNHDDPEVLANFVRWAAKRYPADRYALVFWDHGGQWEGFGGDEQDGEVEDPKGMSPETIRDALAKAMRDSGIRKFDFIAFDCCLMGGMEVLDSFQKLTDTFFACPEIDYGDGWNYEKSFAWLKAHPAAKMREFAAEEVSLWGTLHLTEENDFDRALAAHCAYDLTRYPAVKRAFGDFAISLSKELSPSNILIPKQRRKTVEYSLSGDGQDNIPEYVDLGMFASRFANDPLTPRHLKESSAALAKAIDEMAIAKTLGEEKSGASGLSIWYPVCLPSAAIAESAADDDDDADDDDADDDADEAQADFQEAAAKFDHYKRLELFKSSPWAEYLEKVWTCRANFEDEPEIETDLQGKIHMGSSSESVGVKVDVKSGKGAYLLSASLMARHGKRPDELVFLGEIASKEIDGPGRYSLEWNFTALSIPDVDGRPCVLGAMPKNCAGEIWLSFANYKRNEKARTEKVILLFHVKDGAVKLAKMLDANDDGAAPASLKPQPGGVLTPLYIVERRKGQDPGRWRNFFISSKRKIIIPKEGFAGLHPGMTRIGKGVYLLEVHAEDVNGVYSNTIELPLVAD